MKEFEMPQSESEVEQLITIEARRHDSLLMRNNSGAMTDTTGRTVRFGLDNISKKHQENIRSTDRIGITSIVITPAMVGQTIGVFTAVEVKKPGWKAPMNKRERAQENFINLIKVKGGVAGFVTCIADVVKLLKK